LPFMLLHMHSKNVYGCPFIWKGPEAASSILCRILSGFFLGRDLYYLCEGGTSTPRRPLMHTVSLHAVPFHNLNTALSMLLNKSAM
jgi:hypothetical protein